jgi:YVTN family beta-propeller protein
MKKLAVVLTLASLLAPASARAQNAYITNSGSSTVSVIDTATNTVSATIPVGLNPSA